MYRQCRAITRLHVPNMWLGRTTTQKVFAISSRCSSGISKIEKLLPQTDPFPSRHIGLNPESEQEMTNFLGLEVRLENRFINLVNNRDINVFRCSYLAHKYHDDWTLFINLRISRNWWIKQYPAIYVFKEKWIFGAVQVKLLYVHIRVFFYI